jgi:hypothetical protein
MDIEPFSPQKAIPLANQKELPKETSIFYKKHEVAKFFYKLDKDSILETIPANHYKLQQNMPDKTEWRWRLYNINENYNFIEISFKEPNSNRKFLDKFGKWIEYNLSNDYDKFIQKQFYYYC